MNQNWKAQSSLGILLAMSGATAAFATDFSKYALGTTGAQFLELPVGARAIAMGTAQGAVAQDSTALYYNPAGLAGAKGGDINLMHAVYFQDISYQYGAVAQRMGDGGTIAAGLQYLSPGSIGEIDNTGTLSGTSFQPHDMAATLGYGQSLGFIDYGLGVKYISSKIYDSAWTYAGDFGLRTAMGPVALGAAISDIGPGLKFRGTRETLPTTLRVGGALTLGTWVLAADGVAPRDVKPYWAVGTEYKCQLAEAFAIAARGGYNSRTATSGLGRLAGGSIGGGIDMKYVAIDYAWSPYGDLGNAHRISLIFRWGSDS